MSPVHNESRQSDPLSNPEDQEKADEGDSGIAVVESTTTSVVSVSYLQYFMVPKQYLKIPTRLNWSSVILDWIDALKFMY